MHPLLASPRRLGFYLLAWLPFLVLVDGILGSAGLFGWQRVLLSLAMTVVFAFMALSAWFACWHAPLATTPPGRVVWVQLNYATYSVLVWLALGYGLLMGGESLGAPRGIAAKYTSVISMLAVVGMVAFTLSASVHYMVIAFQQSRAAERRALELQVVAREAELKALRAQIDPHFLFNCLHSISALTTIDAPAARRMCVGLGDFLRATLRVGQQPFITLREELDLIDGYLAIEQVRLGRRLTIDREIDREALIGLVPPLLLHPLVENAITHGISHLLDGGRLGIVIDRVDRMRLSINTGSQLEPEHVVVIPGQFSPEAQLHEGDPKSWTRYLRIRITNSSDPDRPRSGGAGVGLSNVRRRIATIFGNEAGVTVKEETDHFAVEVIVPFRQNASESLPAAEPVGVESR
jgi:two-component system, LytTR family, sensor histidine kinase AlgZ